MKKKYIVFVFVVIGFALGLGILAQTIMTKPDKPLLSIGAKATKEGIHSVRTNSIELVFQNQQDSVIRLLDVFEDPQLIAFFFTLDIRDLDGTPIDTVGGGKVSLSKDALKYIELKKGDVHVVHLPLKDFIPSEYTIKPGAYDIVVRYRNQYGENCFKGSVESLPIRLYLGE